VCPLGHGRHRQHHRKGCRVRKIVFNPRVSKAQLAPITLNLNLDGRTPGTAMSEIMADMFKFSSTRYPKDLILGRAARCSAGFIGPTRASAAIAATSC
jgi:hypothetical protein